MAHYDAYAPLQRALDVLRKVAAGIVDHAAIEAAIEAIEAYAKHSPPQAAYDNMSPPDDGPYECPECNGNGNMPTPGDPDGDYVKCSACDGFGLIEESGEPFDPHAADPQDDE